MKNKFHVTVCFYQYPLALNEIYNWYQEHIRDIVFFKKFREVNNSTPFENLKFIFIVGKNESVYDEIVYCMPEGNLVEGYTKQKIMSELKKKLNHIIENKSEITYSKLLLFGSFTLVQLNNLTENFK